MQKQEENVKKIAETLLKNTMNIYMKKALQKCISGKGDRTLMRVLKFIADDGYDIADFGLDEIPAFDVYCFMTEDCDKAFDVLVKDDKKVTAGYLKGSEVGLQTMCADSIEEAIDKNELFDDEDDE
jgi:hypothetical protein